MDNEIKKITTYDLMTDNDGMVGFSLSLEGAKRQAQLIANDSNAVVYIAIDRGQDGYEDIAEVKPEGEL